MESSYRIAEKRLSNEFDDTIGWAPATRSSFAVGAAVGESETEGFVGPAASFVSGAFGGTVAFSASLRLASVILASATFGFAGAGWALAVVSAAAPTRPTLRAR